MNQGYVKWTHPVWNSEQMAVIVGRQELSLNDGRFLSFSSRRQLMARFDAARVETELPMHFSFTYAFINRF